MAIGSLMLDAILTYGIAFAVGICSILCDAVQVKRRILTFEFASE